MDNKIRVVQYGLGPIGNKITQYLLERDSIQIVGAVDSDPTKSNLDIGELAGLPSAYGVRISDYAHPRLCMCVSDDVYQ